MIHIFKVTDVTDEFSLHCGACGHRRFYLKREMEVEQFIDRRAKPRAA